jgi:hypothetical protein
MQKAWRDVRAMPELASGFAELIAQRVIDEHRTLAARWLAESARRDS